MISVIITSYKEPNTIYKAIRCIGDKEYSGINPQFEIIQISPDQETLEEGKRAALDLNLGEQFKQIIDPHKGKPNALNLGFKKAKGDIILLTDGDVYLDKMAVGSLLEPFKESSIGGVTGRPLPQNNRDNFWGFLAHCFTSAADHKRKSIFTEKKEDYFVSTGRPFPLSGYIFAIRNNKIALPQDLILDDLYISYKIFNENFKLAYAPKAHAYVRFPTNLRDYLKQRRRNLAGHIDLKKHLELKNYKNERSFGAELRYLLYPITFATGIKELFWAFALYPLRLITWIDVLKARITKSSIMKKTGWDRISSTK